jgi:hypothetical protein
MQNLHIQMAFWVVHSVCALLKVRVNTISDFIQKLLARDRLVLDDRLLTIDLDRDATGSDGNENGVASVLARGQISSVKLSPSPKYVAGDRMFGLPLQLIEKRSCFPKKDVVQKRAVDGVLVI